MEYSEKSQFNIESKIIFALPWYYKILIFLLFTKNEQEEIRERITYINKANNSSGCETLRDKEDISDDTLAKNNLIKQDPYSSYDPRDINSEYIAECDIRVIRNKCNKINITRLLAVIPGNFGTQHQNIDLFSFLAKLKNTSRERIYRTHIISSILLNIEFIQGNFKAYRAIIKRKKDVDFISISMNRYYPIINYVFYIDWDRGYINIRSINYPNLKSISFEVCIEQFLI